MAIDALQAQLVTAMERFRSLQRRIPEDIDSSKLLGRVFKELEWALDQLRVAQEQLVENRNRTEALQVELIRQYQKYWELFDDMRDPYVVTKHDSTILEANRAASDLFNVSQRFLVGKTFSVFVEEDRARWLREARQVAETGGSLEIEFGLRPRERAAIHVHARVTAADGMLRWVITRSLTASPRD